MYVNLRYHVPFGRENLKRVLWKEKSHSVTERHTDMKTILYIKG